MGTRVRIGLRQIRALKPGRLIWDSAVVGFGARRQKSDAVAYVLFYRTRDGRQRWHTIGRHGAPWTPDTARDEARKLLGKVTNGEDPSAAKKAARHAKTIAQLCELYIADAETGRLLTRRQTPKKASTLATDRGRIDRHIKPLLGSRTVAAVTREDVDAFMHDVAAGKTACRVRTAKPRGLANVRGGRGTASRTVGLLGAIFSYAVRHRMRADNPVRGVTKFADGKRERRLAADEYEDLGVALRAAEAAREWPPAVAAIRFLALTGWRSGEAIDLRWSDLDLDRRIARLADTKNGHSLRPLSRRACDVLRGLPHVGELVFPATRGDGRMTGLPKIWSRMLYRRGISREVTPHVLRHSFASLAADLGFSELTIASLVGHKLHTVTSRYVHSADAVLLSAADAVAEKTAELMGEPEVEARVIPLWANHA
jgi:integrase